MRWTYGVGGEGEAMSLGVIACVTVTPTMASCTGEQTVGAYLKCPIIIQHDGYPSVISPEERRPMSKCLNQKFPKGSEARLLVYYLNNSSFIESSKKIDQSSRIFVLETYDEKHDHRIVVSFHQDGKGRLTFVSAGDY
jgi:hypothetical protein